VAAPAARTKLLAALLRGTARAHASAHHDPRARKGDWRARAPGTLAANRVPSQATDLELSLPARPENVAVVRHAVGGLGEVLEVPEQTLSDIRLAVTEACTNVVVHAYPDGEGPMGVRATIDAHTLTLVVADRGRGLVPRTDSPGLGLGLPLIATLAQALELGTGDGEETQVRMTFDLDARPSSDGAGS
jgi:anti-sigma regulatory factor (Ser/Thr protein kinase)